MALSMDRPRDRDGNSHKFGAKSRLNSRNQSPGMKSSLKHAYRSKVIGNLKEGQGYADKRKRRFLNNYQKLRTKHRLQTERNQSTTDNETVAPDIDAFAQNIQRDTADNVEGKSNSASESNVSRQTGKGNEHKDGSEIKDKGDPKTGEGAEKKKRFKKRGGKKNAKNRFTKAQAEFTEKKRAEEMRLQALTQQQTERALALERYNKKKMDSHQKLKKKSRRGQPLMKYHMEALLDKIKAQGT
ncbi:thyroid transcription factor 1-associated protein 26 homolog [Strongylocentrotus purpuratus]|uniref:Thyroid transcription factor 1-associated protein 26 homolog n=1 Tax=Strongylocentrotus purpuratus TaxID=7668 RepID=A0A7M7RDP9_STRPU|nr:thyroid transcription factor 1-associated protein 26 homolog [Strongylocentrotus purpuratus]|eukprot:XP_784791.2 PREDICTED: thyroid transcription factor 1-associated protein 26 homolog [Strongylocentrotus purpuratus]